MKKLKPYQTDIFKEYKINQFEDADYRIDYKKNVMSTFSINLKQNIWSCGWIVS